MPPKQKVSSLAEICEAYYACLSDENVPATSEIRKCGETVLQTLRRASAALSLAEDQIDRALAQVKTLLYLADDHINSVDFSKVAKHWLQLHTDASLLLAVLGLHRLSGSSQDSSREPWLRIIHGLDRAIIISGAIGDHRSEWIQTCIKLAQKELPRLPANLSENSKRKRRRVESDTDTPSIFSEQSIPITSSFPSMEEYRSTTSHSPIILRGALLSQIGPCPPWPAIDRWKSAEYLLDLVGDGRIIPVEIGSAYDDAEWTQALLPFRSFLRRAGFNVEVDQEEDELIADRPDGPWYLAQYEICRQFPGLEADYSMPDYVWSHPDLKPGSNPQRLKDPAVNIWFGPGGSQVTTPAHTDPHFNCFAQVLGRKRVWVASPECSRHMYAHGKASAEATAASEYMTNTSTVPIFRPHATVEALASDHPAFCNHVRPQAMEAYLDPGDLLLLPPGWWHAMQGVGEGPGCSVSIWF